MAQTPVIPQRTMQEIRAELTKAAEARQAGNEGMARVCSRRAAGQAVSAYLEKFPHPDWGTSAVNRLAGMKLDTTMPPDVRQAAERLTARVNEEHQLPFAADPITDAEAIIRHLESLTS